MVIPPIGFLIIVITALIAVVRPRLLIYLSAFFVPFSGASVINLPKFELGIVAFTFTAVTWLGAYLVMSLALRSGVVVVAWREPLIRYLALFLLVIAASLIMPVIIDGGAQFEGAGILGNVDTYVIQFSPWHVIHLGYMVIGTLFVVVSTAVIRHDRRIESMIRWYVLGGMFAAVIGLLEALMNKVGIRFPIEFFNSVPTSDFSSTGTGRLDGQLGLLRISSVAQEPSLFGTHLSVIFALLWTHLVSRRVMFSKTVDILFAGLIAAALVFSLSTVAYVGMAMVVGFTALLSLQTVRRMVRATAMMFVLLVGVVAAMVAIPESAEVINYFIFEKVASGSFLERITTVINAFFLAIHYPILGVGWGLVPSFDLFVKIFVGTGLLGLAAFLMLWGSAFRSMLELRRALQRMPKSYATGNAMTQTDGLLVGLLTLTVMYTVNGFEYRYGDFWVLLVLIAATRQRHVSFHGPFSRPRTGVPSPPPGANERAVPVSATSCVPRVSPINLD